MSAMRSEVIVAIWSRPRLSVTSHSLVRRRCSEESRRPAGRHPPRVTDVRLGRSAHNPNRRLAPSGMADPGLLRRHWEQWHEEAEEDQEWGPFILPVQVLHKGQARLAAKQPSAQASGRRMPYGGPPLTLALCRWSGERHGGAQLPQLLTHLLPLSGSIHVLGGLLR
jgi:hypothetical protein